MAKEKQCPRRGGRLKQCESCTHMEGELPWKYRETIAPQRQERLEKRTANVFSLDIALLRAPILVFLSGSKPLLGIRYVEVLLSTPSLCAQALFPF